MKLHWERVKVGLHYQWQTEEQLHGTPDFLIVRQGTMWRMKSRSARQWQLFDSLEDAKNYAESI